MKRLHEWYYLACVCGLQFIKGCIHEKVFKSRSFDLNIKLFEIHTIYRLGMLDIIMMTVMCTLVHVADDEKRLGFMNSTQINQLELNPVINEKSDMFKGMSKKKRVTTIKNTTKSDQREKRSCINSHRSTISSVRRQTMYQLYLMNYNINMFVCLCSHHWILAMICPKKIMDIYIGSS
jgi:hypothetical protein